MTPPLPADVAATLAQIDRELVGAARPPLAADDALALAAACTGDPARLKRWLKRRLTGEPLAYILGELTFRGRRFRIDKRAYITDPETSHVVDAVLAASDAFSAQQGRAPIVAEFGCGCGSLGLSLKLERPNVAYVGLELDADALALARLNAEQYHLDVSLVESDLFDAWPLAAPPDFIFGDPPWGADDTLYDAERDAAHYHAMPAASAFPLGGRTGVHAQLLRAVRLLGWRSHLVLNGGVLPPTELRTVALSAGAVWVEIAAPRPGISLLHCRMN